MFIILSFILNSCALEQYTNSDYQKVYFDHVVYGYVNNNSYVYDGSYSYHIIGVIPHNVYWELCPYRRDVYLYNKQMNIIRLFEWTRRSIYYNRNHHHYFYNKYPYYKPRPNYNREYHRPQFGDRKGVTPNTHRSNNHYQRGGRR